MTPTAEPGSNKYTALAAMVFAVAMTFIDQTIVSIAVPDISGELGISASAIQWVINGYLLSLSAFFAFGGRLADILGHRRMVLIGVTIFAVASALCGATPEGDGAEAWLIIFRVIQGFGAALLFPAALAIVVAAFPLRQRGRALAIFFGISGGLTAIGPILGGWLTQYTWRAIFWVNVPVAIIAIVLTWYARVNPAHRREKLDWRGAGLIVAGMALSVLGLQQASSWGWDSWRTWLCIVAGFAILVIFVLVELRTETPLIKVRIFRDRAFTIDNAVLFFGLMAFVPLFFFASVYSQISLGQSASGAGLYLLIFFGGFVVAAQIGGRMLDQGGARRPMIVGCVLGTIGFAFWARSLTTLSEGSQWYWIILSGAGIGFFLGPASTDAVNRAINASYGEVTGITQTLRNYGSSLSLAILGTVLLQVGRDKITTSLSGLGVPSADAATAANSLMTSTGASNAASALPPSIRDAAFAAIQRDYAEASRVVFYGMAVALFVALCFALFHPGGKVEYEATEPVETPTRAARRDDDNAGGPLDPPVAPA
ncbi:MFS transporter [Asanoa ishikariensis]|uniref:Drug resistance transporter, EmrB/QacA subfamily n=1 Tax=Asanoa ishikariensis TaxID=137265 RepID=A0A1H3L9N2_9ACTN|nr:MFS transporter [Asanoa ishikariensis]GIF65338.1 MFS transporter [Asanoa ishikariensis]SDY60996.1 drug resistance transporter, EmrB/QacA subfamily [Asanoa ishikariensis]